MYFASAECTRLAHCILVWSKEYFGQYHPQCQKCEIVCTSRRTVSALGITAFEHFDAKVRLVVVSLETIDWCCIREDCNKKIIIKTAYIGHFT